MRESIPRQVGKKSGVPKEERGVWASQGKDRGLEFSRRRKGYLLSYLHYCNIIRILCDVTVYGVRICAIIRDI